MIDFEKDQQEVIKKTDNIQSLADQVERLEGVASSIEAAEERIKDLKKKRDYISGEVIPTMMSEMLKSIGKKSYITKCLEFYV